MSEFDDHYQDMLRFPRVIPEGMEHTDRHPLLPVDEHIRPVVADLLGVLVLAQAPHSGKAFACSLVAEHEYYGGYTIEHSLTDVEDPFEMALSKVPPGTELYGMAVTGSGDIKEKHTLPSGEMYDKIAPLMRPGSPIVVVTPNKPDTFRRIPSDAHQIAYSPKIPSVFTAKTVRESYSEALWLTALSPEDCNFVAVLRHAGLRDDTHYYLTGSATGESGPSYALKPGMYTDLDFIAVSNRPKEEVEASFEAVANIMYGILYGPLEKEPKVVRIAGTDKLLEGARYYNDDGLSIDFYVTTKLNEAFVRREYLERNYYHKLS